MKNSTYFKYFSKAFPFTRKIFLLKKVLFYIIPLFLFVTSCGTFFASDPSVPLKPDDNIPEPGVYRLQAQSDIGKITLTWEGPETGAAVVLYSSSPNCTWLAPQEALCPDFGQVGPLTQRIITLDETNLHLVTTTKPYFFVLKASDEISAVVGGRIYNPQPDGAVNALALTADGSQVYLGGSFSNIGIGAGAGVTLDISTRALSGGLPWVAGVVYTAIPDGVGGWYIGGSFDFIDGFPRKNLAHITSVGALSEWNPTVESSTGIAAQVRALALSSDGSKLYVGGVFNHLGQNDRKIDSNHIGAFDLKENTVLPWNAGIEGDSVNAMAISVNGGMLYVGGQFHQAGLESRSHLAAFSTQNDHALAPWDPRVANSTNTAAVKTVVLSPDGGTLYVGGIFSQIGQNFSTYGHEYLTALDLEKNTIRPWDFGIKGHSVNALALSEDGQTLYVGGQFSAAGPSLERNHLASFSVQGQSVLTTWNPGVTSATGTANVQTLALSAGGEELFVGGQFQTAGVNQQPRQHFAVLETQSGEANSWHAGLLGQEVSTITLSPNGHEMYLGGNFHTLNAQPRSRLAVLKGRKLQTTLFDIMGESVESFALSRDKTTLYLGGQFTAVNGSVRQNAAAINTVSQSLTTWTPQTFNSDVQNPIVYSMAELPGVNTENPLYAYKDALIVGGSFVKDILGNPAWPAKNNLYFPFNSVHAGTPADGNLPIYVAEIFEGPGVFAQAICPRDSTYYIGGEFSSAQMSGSRTPAFLRNGLARAYVGKTAGPCDDLGTNVRQCIEAWDPAMAGSAQVKSLALRNYIEYNGEDPLYTDPWDRPLASCDDKIFVGGALGSFAGTVPSQLVALSTQENNAPPLSWNPEIQGELVDALALSSDGRMLYAGGVFSQGKHGVLRQNIVAIPVLNTDGTLADGTLSPNWNPGADGAVNALMLGIDGELLYVGGDFTRVGIYKHQRGNRYFDILNSLDGELK